MESDSRSDHAGPWRALTPRRALIAVALAVAAFGIGAWSLYLWSDYRTTVDAAHARGQATLDALGEHTRRLVVTNDLLLQQMLEMPAGEWHRQYRTDELAWRRIRDLAELPQQSVVLSVLDATGELVISSRAFGPLPRAVKLADRPYFEAHQQGTDNGLLIGPTVFSRVDNRPCSCSAGAGTDQTVHFEA
jgi:hypothetical protein